MKYLTCVLLVIACGDNRSAPIDAPVRQFPDAAAAIDAPADADATPLAGCGEAADCVDGELCTWAPQHACGADSGRGTCEPVTGHFCPSLAFLVCGCDGNDYFNECISRTHGSDVAYGGPCRPAGQFEPCTTSTDCTSDDLHVQYCVDDPRDDCDPLRGDASCAGLCVHANQTCSETLPCLSEGSHAVAQSPNTEACVPLLNADPAGDPAACVYTTRMHCLSGSDCGDGEVCLPDLACPPASGCLGWCVRP
jgi:hypothetical protein